jgi:phosphonate transport system substrate-binding protein
MKVTCTRRQSLHALMAAGTFPSLLMGVRNVHAQTSVRDSGTHYSIAVVPQFPAAELHRDWTPLLQRVNQTTGLNVSLKLAPNIPRFESELLAGSPDFAFINPYHAVMAFKEQGYLPLLRNAQPLTGILVVQRQSPIRHLKELDRQEIAFPAPNAFGASLWMRALLAEREGIQISPSYVQTHSNVYRQVLRGRVAAGGGVNNTLKQESDEVQSLLRVLFETPGVAPHPLCVHPRVPAAVRQALSDAIAGLVNDAAGQGLLKNIFMSKPVKADYARDYQALEQYKLEKYVVLEQHG